MEQQLTPSARRVAGRPRPKTLLVFGREPGSLRACQRERRLRVPARHARARRRRGRPRRPAAAVGGHEHRDDSDARAGGHPRAALRRVAEAGTASRPNGWSGTRWRRFPPSRTTGCICSSATSSSCRARASSSRPNASRARCTRKRSNERRRSSRGRAARTARGWCTCCGNARDVEVGALLTTINEAAQRVAMHAVRVELLRGAGASARAAAVAWSRFRRRARTRSTSARWRAAVSARGRRGVHARRVRRSLSRGRPAVSRGAARRHRADAAVSAVRQTRHAAAGARDDRGRPAARITCVTRACSIGASPAASSIAALLADLPRVGRSVRRARRVPHVRVRRADVQPPDADRDRHHRRARRIRVHGSVVPRPTSSAAH